MSLQTKQFYEFGQFRLDAEERLLLREGEVVPLTPKAFDLLLVLVEHHGHLVGKEELLKAVWPDTFVEEANLSYNISLLRKALGESPGDQRFIQTVPKKGYRFTADVRERRLDGAEIYGRLSVGQLIEAREEEAGGGEVAVKDGLPGGAQTEEASGLITPAKRGLALALSAFTIVVLAFALYMFAERRGPVTKFRTLAVLPFKPLAANDRDESLELGMADTLIAKLSSVREIVVRPVSAVRKYSGLDQDAVAAGRELGVEAVLDGSLQRAGERVRVRVRLVRVADGGMLWADKFDMKFPDIFAVQDSISERVARSLAVRLSGEERRQMAKRYTENMEAYHLYLKGRYFWNKRTGDGIKKGIEYFHQAIALDLNYALAYSGLADSYALGILSSDVNPEESFPRAKEAAERALSLDDTLAEAHTSLARVKEMFEWDFTGAESEYRRALDLNPNYASAHHRLGLFLSMMGRFDEGLEQLEQARQLDPMSLTINADIGLAHYFARRYDQSVDQLLKTIEMDQSFPPARYYLAEVYVQKRMFDEAIAEARKASELTGGGSWTVLSYSYAAAGRKEEAREVLKDLTAGRWSFQPIALAATYAELGDTDEAFARLEKSYEQRAFLMHRLRVDPKVDDLRPDPRFQDLMRRIGLPQ